MERTYKMSTYEITFSPTGGTSKIADAFASAFDSDTIQIDLTNAKTDFSTFLFHAEDVCMIAVPSYGGRVPAAAVSRLEQMTGGTAKAVLRTIPSDLLLSYALYNRISTET